ncbi:hypothetical protein [Paraglaciecola hydrolytica]|uniref:Uncharacterized protein n=1 Tax=Paraglaciecola hydrolytica TaxID=1799789 RepID=A0A148KKG3_9ALTE|nr:hypothetical protein [Paraglaciecola hydrolytica]KXI26786.1 hypothetical protein AX660_03180 [Paraglaciecola hydrolytica]
MTAIRENVVNFASKVTEWLIYGCVAILLVEEFIRSVFNYSFLTTENSDARISIGIFALTTFIAIMKVEVSNMRILVSRSTTKLLGVLEVLHSHENIDFCEMLETASEIKVLSLSGTKAASLGDGRVQELLSDPSRKSKITILLANPYSEAIKTRYMKDEPDSFETGIEGINRRLIALKRIISELPIVARKKIDVRVFNNYPVVSIVQADNDLYSTTYGYKLRGGDCPKVHSLKNGEHGVFLLRHFKKVYDEAIPLFDWYEKFGEDQLLDSKNEE